MKTSYSSAWKKSTKPSKQRKYAYNAPLHTKSKFLSCNLTKSLRREYGIRNVRVKTKDTVKIMRGEHKGKTGEITKVNIKGTTVNVKGITRKKVSGQESNIPIKPSNIQIIELDLKDDKRLRSLRRKKQQNQPKESPAKDAQKDNKKDKS